VCAHEVLQHFLPQFFPENWLAPPGIAYRNFPSCIRVGYVLRGDGNYSYLCEEEFSALSLTVEEIHAQALQNLSDLPSAEIAIAKRPDGAEGWIHAPEDNFAAVRILLPEVQEVFRRELGDEFLVTLPHRDDCFCWSSTQTAERQAQHAADAMGAFRNEQYHLTPEVLRFTRGEFELRRCDTVV
jgi:uncharacterized protein YtpQ (UPF0354 family)